MHHANTNQKQSTQFVIWYAIMCVISIKVIFCMLDAPAKYVFGLERRGQEGVHKLVRNIKFFVAFWILGTR